MAVSSTSRMRKPSSSRPCTIVSLPIHESAERPSRRKAAPHNSNVSVIHHYYPQLVVPAVIGPAVVGLIVVVVGGAVEDVVVVVGGAVVVVIGVTQVPF